MRVPTAASILASSRIAIQEIIRFKQDPGIWEGSDKADVLWCKDLSFEVDVEIPYGAFRWMKLFLICDPNYAPLEVHTEEDFALISHVAISPTGKSLDGRPVPYDLGWTLRPRTLPSGRVRFSIKVAEHDYF